MAIELVAMALAGLSAILFSAPGSTLYAAILAWGLLALAWIDAKHFYLPDAIVLPLILVGFAATFWLQPENLPGHVLGAGAGYLSFRCINVLYKILRHRDGLGQGDAKLLALAGAWVGWEVLPWVVLAASILGVLYAFSLLLLGKKDISATMRLPFGTLLAPAIFAAYVFNVLQI